MSVGLLLNMSSFTTPNISSNNITKDLMLKFLSPFWVSNLAKGMGQFEKKLPEVSNKWIACTRLLIINQRIKDFSK